MLRVSGLTVAFGEEPILEGINLEVKAGDFVSLIGPSGSGKTSILRAVTGLLEAGTGEVELDVEAEDVGFLFQDDALLPWRTARQNVALGMQIRGLPKAEAEKRADEWLSRLGLGRFGDRYPRQLSGGQLSLIHISEPTRPY